MTGREKSKIIQASVFGNHYIKNIQKKSIALARAGQHFESQVQNIRSLIFQKERKSIIGVEHVGQEP